MKRRDLSNHRKCVAASTVDGHAFCVRVHSDADKSRLALAGYLRTIVQRDVRTSRAAIEYDQHSTWAKVNRLRLSTTPLRVRVRQQSPACMAVGRGCGYRVLNFAEARMHTMPTVVAHPDKDDFFVHCISNQSYYSTAEDT